MESQHLSSQLFFTLQIFKQTYIQTMRNHDNSINIFHVADIDQNDVRLLPSRPRNLKSCSSINHDRIHVLTADSESWQRYLSHCNNFAFTKIKNWPPETHIIVIFFNFFILSFRQYSGFGNTARYWDRCSGAVLSAFPVFVDI